jgi:site-specific recombinase XerD
VTSDDGLPARSSRHGTELEPASRDAVDLARASDVARELVERGVAANTRRAYRSAWASWEAWAQAAGVDPRAATARDVALHVADLVDHGRGLSTIRVRLAAIAAAYAAAGVESPTREPVVAAVVRGARRSVRPASRKDPIGLDGLARMVGGLGAGVAGKRDRALLLLGFAGAFRRSELVALDVAHVREVADGLVVLVERSKTDPDGRGFEVGIPHARRCGVAGACGELCPVAAVRAWREAAGIDAGALFRRVERYGAVRPGRLGDRAVALVVKRAAVAAGIDPRALAGHSLRAGLATEAAAAGVPDRVIAGQGRWRSVATVARYVRHGSLFTENAARRVL